MHEAIKKQAIYEFGKLEKLVKKYIHVPGVDVVAEFREAADRLQNRAYRTSRDVRDDYALGHEAAQDVANIVQDSIGCGDEKEEFNFDHTLNRLAEAIIARNEISCKNQARAKQIIDALCMTFKDITFSNIDMSVVAKTIRDQDLVGAIDNELWERRHNAGEVPLAKDASDTQEIKEEGIEPVEDKDGLCRTDTKDGLKSQHPCMIEFYVGDEEILVLCDQIINEEDVLGRNETRLLVCLNDKVVANFPYNTTWIVRE